MNLTTWNPMREFDDIFNRYQRLLGRGSTEIGNQETMATADWAPTVDVIEKDKEYVIKAELPGVEKEDTHITVENGVLTLKGTRQSETKEEGDKYHRHLSGQPS